MGRLLMKIVDKLPKGLLALLGVAICLIVTPAYALDVDSSGHFELGDGIGSSGAANILGDDVTQPGPDWANIFDGDGNVLNLFGGVGAAFAQDDLSLKGLVDSTIFASSNKNGDLVATWQWNKGNTPPKDDISTSYVYAKLVAGKLIIYGGIERIDASGDSHVDIEFNQSSVTLDKDPPCDGDGTGEDGIPPGNDGKPCEYRGVREVDDFVVSMDFEKGGGLGVVRVFTWDGSAFNQIEEVVGEGCNTGDTVCAYNNSVPIDGGPWPNFSKSGPVGTIDPNGFTEFGIDVEGTLGVNFSPCFATVNFKTRSSQSFTSELKDFSLHEFQQCIATVTTEVRTNPGDVLVANDASPTPLVGSVPVGSTLVDDTATVTGLTGIIPTGNVAFYIHSTIDCSDTGVLHDTEALPGSTTPETVTSDTLILNTPGNFGFKATYEGDGNYPAANSGCEAFAVTTLNTSVNTKVLRVSDGVDVTNLALDLTTVVHDKAFVMGDSTVGDPTGTVTFRRYSKANCTGTFTDDTKTLVTGTPDGISTAISDAITLSTEAFHCWQVFYNGEDPDYNASSATVGEPICAFDFSPILSSP